MIEGLPGSGKSTTAEIVSRILTEANVANELFSEGRLDHPADYDGVAFFDVEKFHQLTKSCELTKDALLRVTTEKAEGYFVEYKKGLQEYQIEFPGKLTDEFYQNDIYELPLPTHMQLIKNKWSDFVRQAREEEQVYIFDCPFMQNPVTVTMIRDNADKDLVVQYIQDLANIIKELNPLLIYVDQKDLSNSFKKVIDVRPHEWLDFFVRYYTRQGYGLALGCEGLEGTLQVLAARKTVELDILAALDMHTHIVDNSELDLDKLKSSLCNILPV